MNDIDNFKRLEGMLYSVPKIKAEIDNIRLDMDELAEINVLAATGTDGKGSTPTNAYNSTVENEAIRVVNIKSGERYKALERRSHKLERKLRKIENMLNVLGEKDKLLIHLKYFELMPVSHIVEVLGYATNQGYSKRKKKIIVKDLLPLFINCFGEDE